MRGHLVGRRTPRGPGIGGRPGAARAQRIAVSPAQAGGQALPGGLGGPAQRRTARVRQLRGGPGGARVRRGLACRRRRWRTAVSCEPVRSHMLLRGTRDSEPASHGSSGEDRSHARGSRPRGRPAAPVGTRARRARPDLAGAGHRHAGLRPCRRREHGGARTIRGNRRGRDRRPSPATPSAGRASWAWRCRRPGPPPATLLAISEKLRHLALATGNKTELSIGSATLYGDMAGDFAPIKDCSKTLLYQLARHRNARGAAIPEEVLSKPPSAILRESVDLPPYAVLDSIVERYVANGEGLDEIMRSGLDRRHPWRAPADRRRRDRPAAGAARGQDQRAGIRQGSPHADQQRMAALRRRGGAAGSRQGPRAAVRPQPPM